MSNLNTANEFLAKAKDAAEHGMYDRAEALRLAADMSKVIAEGYPLK